ncbi:MAG: tRNA (adenosine(37)-N6)-dimethylallyltransferase MiaA [bacterium]
MIYIFYGPTGSGKTDLAIDQILNNRIKSNRDGEVISADSRQVYIGMDVGTNKDRNKLIKNNIKYHLIDILTPDKKFSVWQWNQLAKEKIQEIISRGNDICIVGGTGLYIDSLLYPREYLSFGGVESLSKESKYNTDNLSIEEIQKQFAGDFNQEYELLNSSERLNKRRLLNNYLKLKLKESPKLNNYVLEKGSFKLVTPEYTSEELYKKINNRVEKMFEEGFIDEVRYLIERGYKDAETMNGSGYKEIKEYLLEKNESVEELNNIKEEIKKSHRNYAKRQITWFKKYVSL